MVVGVVRKRPKTVEDLGGGIAVRAAALQDVFGPVQFEAGLGFGADLSEGRKDGEEVGVVQDLNFGFGG